MTTNPSLALIITTYNWPQALELVLMSVKLQSILPDEVIIADDGSGTETTELIKRFQADFPVPLIHSWQEDLGFRAARSRNLAMAKAKSDYLVMIDGDMILHRHFIRDHARAAQADQFVQGRRVILDQPLTVQTLQQKRLYFSPFTSGLKNKEHAFSLPLISPLISTAMSKQSYQSIRSCNLAVWRADVLKINGFNEAFVGWGREDSEFALRLLNSGIKRYDLRFGGIAYHFYHHENSRQSLPQNDALLAEAIKQQAKRCEDGIDKHLNDIAG